MIRVLISLFLLVLVINGVNAQPSPRLLSSCSYYSYDIQLIVKNSNSESYFSRISESEINYIYRYQIPSTKGNRCYVIFDLCKDTLGREYICIELFETEKKMWKNSSKSTLIYIQVDSSLEIKNYFVELPNKKLKKGNYIISSNAEKLNKNKYPCVNCQDLIEAVDVTPKDWDLIYSKK